MSGDKKRGLTVTFYGDWETRMRLAKMAHAEKRSMSGMLRVLIAEGAERRGIAEAAKEEALTGPLQAGESAG